MTIGNTFQLLTNVKKNFNFLCSGDSRYPSVDTVKLGKTLKNTGKALTKIVNNSILLNRISSCRFTNEETRFISFKDLSCILSSKLIFRQYLKFHALSVLATKVTR